MNKQQLILTLHYGSYEHSYSEIIPILYSSIEELKKDLRLKIIEQIESQSNDRLISINENKKEKEKGKENKNENENENHNLQEKRNPILEFIPQLLSQLYDDYLFSKEMVQHCSDYQIANNIYKSSQGEYYFIEELDIQTLEEWLLNNNIEPSLGN